MSRIIPTVGRIVYYYTAEVPGMAPREGPFAAIITRVHHERRIDLQVFYPGGKMVDLCNPTSIVLQQEGDRPVFNTEPYATWMPYQIGQATKTEAPKPVYAALDRCDDGCAAASGERAELSAPRVTMAEIEANIASEHYFTAGQGITGAHVPLRSSFSYDSTLDLLTFCILVLRNGFTVTGESACVSPKNFDAEKGREIARKNAIDKIWPLMGYALKDRLAA